jgi:hypothetical protein
MHFSPDKPDLEPVRRFFTLLLKLHDAEAKRESGGRKSRSKNINPDRG